MSDYEHPLLRDKWKDRELWESIPKTLARVQKTDLYYEPGRGLIFLLELKYGSGMQCWLVNLADLTCAEPHPGPVAALGGLELVQLVFSMFLKDRLKDLEGSYIYAIKDGPGWQACISGVAQADPDGDKFFLMSDWRNWNKTIPKVPGIPTVSGTPTEDRK